MKRSVFAATGLALTLVLAACGGEEASPEPAAAASPIASDVIIIDVRTPEEFAGGHVEGALNLDISDGTLEAALPTLDPAASYIVYCRSGNRSAAAVQLMRAAGFTTIDDLGPVANASQVTGLPVVTG